MATDDGFAYEGIKANVVYKPPMPYAPQNNTGVTKTNRLYDGIMMDGTILVKSVDTTAANSTTIYTVPATKTFFLVNAQVNMAQRAAGQCIADLRLDKLQNQVLIGVKSEINGTGTNAIFTPSLPARFRAGSIFDINLDGAAAKYVTATITGYEIETALLQGY